MILEHDWIPASLPPHVSLDDNVYLHSVYAFNHASMRSGAVRVGEHTALYSGTMFDLGPSGSVAIGKYCLVNSAHFVTNSRIVIGDYAHISYEVFLTDTRCPVPPVDAAYDALSEDDDRSIEIGVDCWIGLRSVVLGGTRLGNGVIVGAGSVVHGNFPDLALVGGCPAVQRGWARP